MGDRNVSAIPRLRNDIRNQLVFEPHDTVFQNEFLLFEPRNLQLVDRRVRCKRPDGIVQITMLNFQLFQLLLITVIVHVVF